MATPRETLKYYFRKYALPTEQQFAELIDAFVHKDEDMLTQEKIDGLTAALESKVSAETLEQYKAEVQAMIEEASSGVSNISERLDTADDNIAGHETRIKALEQAEGVTVDEYLSDTSENPVQNKTVFSALEEKASQTEFQNLQSLVESFLNDADASEATINKWKELESFLSGITDQETLSGLLAALKEEIIALIPEPQQGNFVKQIADLDSYEGAEGEIVQYVGTTTQSFTRGFFYERKEGEEVSLPAHTSRLHIVNLELKDGVEEDLNGWYVPTDDTLTYCLPNTMNTGNRVYGLPLNANSQYISQSQGLKTLGEVTNVYSSGYTEFASGQSFTAAEMQRLNDETKYFQSTIWENVQTGKKIIVWSDYNSSSYNLVSTNSNDTILATDGAVITGIYFGKSSSGDEQNTIWKDPEDTIEIGSTPASWQVIPVGPCVG